MKKVYVGADHAGFSLKQHLLKALRERCNDVEFIDLGCKSEASVDYPNFAEAVGRKVAAEKASGVLICGSGLGMCIAANKVRGVRATSAWDVTSAKLSRLHNDSNVICIGARLIGSETATESVMTWLATDFQGDRHQKRIDLVKQLEDKWKS